ncbi:YceI family protein [Wenyingzhuangia sp. IMCC45467]
MKKSLFYSLIFLLGTTFFYGQKNLFKTNNAIVKFDAAKTNIEPIKAENQKAKIVLNTNTGEIACLMNMVDFEFPNKLMQEHFNENYIESEKYPKATFTGRINNFNTLNFNTEQTINVTGNFKIHGQTQQKTVLLKILKEENLYVLTSNFTIQLKDFKIKIPSIMFLKIAEEVEVQLTAKLKEL